MLNMEMEEKYIEKELRYMKEILYKIAVKVKCGTKLLPG